MYSPPQFDTFIDFSMKHEDEILCKGRGRPSHAERVPRLPYTAFAINKQLKEDQLTAGKRKRGRGRASIIKNSTQKSDTHSFSSRDSNSLESGRVGLMTNSTQDVTLGYFDNNDNYVEEAGYCLGQEEFPILKGERSFAPNERVKSLQRQKERQNHKVNFAEINRQMLKDIAGSFTNNKVYHKPARVLSLTKANLEKHARDTDEAMRFSKAKSFDKRDSNAPIFEQYGVTHEDIWEYKHNPIKMPQKVKDEVKQFTDSQLFKASCDKGILDTNDTIQVNKCVVTESEHQKQVNFLTQLYDEDCWSNGKELSECSFNEISDANIADVKDKPGNTMSSKPSTDKQLYVGDVCLDALSLNDSSEFDEFYFFGEGDINTTVRLVENGQCVGHETSDYRAERMSICDKSSQSNTVIAIETSQNNSVKCTSIDNDSINNIKKEEIDIITSDILKPKVGQPESSEKKIPTNKSLANESQGLPRVKERVNGEIQHTVTTECDKPNSTTAQLDEINMPFCYKSADVEKEAFIHDEMVGFQLVKKKRPKKKSSLSPKQKVAVKSDNTIWKLYGKDVIQVDGLPPSYDMTSLYSMVNGFGNVLDFQAKNIDGVCSIRFRLPDEDGCEYAVLCLDKTELFADDGCVLSCFKLSN